MDPCSVGIAKDWECHKRSHTSQTGLIEFADLEESQQELVVLRSGVTSEVKTLCHHHKQFLLVKYEAFERVCCDPYRTHEKSRKGKYFHKINQNYRFKCYNHTLSS